MRSWRPLLALLLVLPLVACGGQSRTAGPATGFAAAQPALPQVERTRVGLLLPLSGGNQLLGQAMQNAAQLALFDLADPRVEFVPLDTAGTTAGAGQAARRGVAAGARVLAGPLTSAETAAAAIVARAARTPLLAFTNDAGPAGQGVWALGLTPQQQVDRMVGAAVAAGASRFALAAPDDQFGRLTAQALRARVAGGTLPPPFVLLHPARTDMAQVARDLAQMAGEAPVDAILIGHTGTPARQLAAALVLAFPQKPRLLGNSLWALDPQMGQEPALAGAWFPAPDPSARQNFEQRYQAAFGERPPRLAGVAYDAAALAARTARDSALPVGEAFLGADGPIRLLPTGQMARGLAVFALNPAGEPQLVQPAPVPGATGS